MPLLIFESPVMKFLTVLVFMLCILISFKNQNADTKKGSTSNTTTSSSSPSFSSWDLDPSLFMSPLSLKRQDQDEPPYERSLEYDFYRDTCPLAEKIVRGVVRRLFKNNGSAVGPALIRLAFHDCFIEGCDASVLLDATEDMDSEKDSPPNESLKGFDVIDTIKSEIEEVCPGVVSCADIVVLAARESVLAAGGPFYPLHTGRRDGSYSFADTATYELPSPHADLSETLASFGSRGFDVRETVSLLGAHSVGVIHCKFFQNRLYNFAGTHKPDPSVDAEFLNLMRSRCPNSTMPMTPMAAPPFHASYSSSQAPPHTSSSSSPAVPPFHASYSSSAAPPISFDSSVSSLTAPSPSIESSDPSSTVPSTFIERPVSSTIVPSPSNCGSSSSSTKEKGRKASLSSLAAASPSFKSSISFSPSSSTSFETSMFSSPDKQGLNMAYEGPGVDFGALYYRSLLQGRGILYADQQLMAGEETGLWVRAYASDVSLFRRDFALAMMKLSDLQVLTGSMGQVRRNCSKV